MEMDAHGPVALTDIDALDLYCDRVASAVDAYAFQFLDKLTRKAARSPIIWAAHCS